MDSSVMVHSNKINENVLLNETVVSDGEQLLETTEDLDQRLAQKKSLLNSKRSLKGVLHPDKDDLKRDDIVNRQSFNSKSIIILVL